MGTVRVGLAFILFFAPIVFGALGRQGNGNFFQKLTNDSYCGFGKYCDQLFNWHAYCMGKGEKPDVTGLTTFCLKNRKFRTSGAAVDSFLRNFTVSPFEEENGSGVIIRGQFASASIPPNLFYGRHSDDYLEVAMVDKVGDDEWDIVMDTLISAPPSTEVTFYEKVTGKGFVAVLFSPNHAPGKSALPPLDQWFQ